jgi:hypothetical protein
MLQVNKNIKNHSHLLSLIKNLFVEHIFRQFLENKMNKLIIERIIFHTY